MQRFPDIEPLVAQYAADCRPDTADRLGSAGGFSGAQLWRLSAPRGLLCLRQLPVEFANPARLEWLHSVVTHVTDRGFALLPDAIAARSGAVYTWHDGCFWELRRWMPGRADYSADPRPEKLDAAMTALAEFHRAAESFTIRWQAYGPTSPGIRERLELVERLTAGDLRGLRNAAIQGRRRFPELVDLACELLERVAPHLIPLRSDLRQLQSVAVPLQPCLRDIWHDHVLFEGDRVSGIIDLCSMKTENVAADIARLLGSLCQSDLRAWAAGLSAYEAIRPLSGNERRLLAAFERSQLFLAGVKWVEWVFVEERVFSDPSAVLQRMEHILARLREARL